MRKDDAYLLDILIAARDAVAFVTGLTKEQFDASRVHQLAVLKALEIIGEAAARLSQGTREAHPEIPWREIIGMRHRLVHGYFEVDFDKGLGHCTSGLATAHCITGTDCSSGRALRYKVRST